MVGGSIDGERRAGLSGRLRVRRDHRPLVIEDDGRACHAHVRGPTGNIVSEVCLYNRVATPAEAGAVDAAISHGTHAVDWGKQPFPSSDADFRALMSRSTNRPTVFSILMRDELLAMLDVGEGIGRCRLAKADGPLALRLPRPGDIYWQVVHPHWKQVDIYNGGDAFLRTFAAAPEPAGHLLALHLWRVNLGETSGSAQNGMRRPIAWS